MKTDDPLDSAIGRLCTNDRAAMRTLFEQSNQRVFGVIILLLSNEADQRRAMIETYRTVWESRRERLGVPDGHLDWILAIARRSALKLRTEPKGQMASPSATTDRLAHFTAAPVYAQAALSPIEQSILIDSYVAAENTVLLEKRYNLKSGQVLTELRRIIRRIGESAR